MLRTSMACAALASAAWFCASSLTEDFEVWTAEGARRLRVAQAPVAAPHAVLAGSDTTLHDALARRVTIASFIYTRCPTVCLAMGSTFQQLQHAIDAQPAKHIGLLSISFDPAHDTVDELARYATQWRADARHWQIVTVPDAMQRMRLLAAWQVVVIDDGRGGWEHNAALLVIDQRGHLVRIFDDADGATALAFARSL